MAMCPAPHGTTTPECDKRYAISICNGYLVLASATTDSAPTGYWRWWWKPSRAKTSETLYVLKCWSPLVWLTTCSLAYQHLKPRAWHFSTSPMPSRQKNCVCVLKALTGYGKRPVFQVAALMAPHAAWWLCIK